MNVEETGALTPTKTYLDVRFDVTGLTDEEIGQLAVEVSVQAECSEFHPSVPYPESETVVDTDDEPGEPDDADRAPARPPIVVSLSGAEVIDVENVPSGTTLEVRQFHADHRDPAADGEYDVVAAAAERRGPPVAGETPSDPPPSSFTFRVEGVEEQTTFFPTQAHGFGETYQVDGEHPAEALEKLVRGEIEWGILDAGQEFTITFVPGSSSDG